MDGSQLTIDPIVKSKVKQPYLTSITRKSNSTDKPEVDGALILLPPRHQCSVLRVFKATLATQNGKKSKQGCEIRESNSGPLARRPRTNRLSSTKQLREYCRQKELDNYNIVLKLIKDQ